MINRNYIASPKTWHSVSIVAIIYIRTESGKSMSIQVPNVMKQAIFLYSEVPNNCTAYFITYRKIASSSMSWLVAHIQIFRRLMKGKFDAYVLWPLTKKFQNWIVNWSTARNFTVSGIWRWEKNESTLWDLETFLLFFLTKYTDKGQLIWKWPFGVFKSTIKPTKFF